MKSWLIRATIAGAVLLSACAPATTPSAQPGPAAPATAAPVVPQPLTYGTHQFPASLDTRVTVTGSARRNDIYETLVIQDTTGKNVLPLLAKSWELKNPTTWEFTIVTDRKFHDGAPMTIDDVVFSFQELVDPAKRFPTAARIGALPEIAAVGTDKLRLVTTAPDPVFLKKLTQVAIYPKAKLQSMGADAFFQKPIGTGPFMVKEWAAGDHLTLVPFPEHPTRKAKLSELTIRFIPEPSARIAGLRTGTLDYISAVPIMNIDQLKGEGFVVHANMAGFSEGYTFDLMQDSPLKDRRVRWALNYAVDKDAIVKNIYKGFSAPEQGQPVQPETFGFNPNLKPYPYDPATAKRLLAEAGYADGFKIKADVWAANAERPQIALFVQSQWKELGVEAEMNVFNQAAVYSDKGYGRAPREPILAAFAANAPAMDADYSLDFFRGSHPSGLKRYDNPDLDRVFNQSRTEMDSAKREKLLQDALAIFREDAPYLFLIQTPMIFAWSSKVGGLTQRVPDDALFDLIFKSS
jgi:peptide/nickel transport system substrate-binding protein